MQAKLIIEFNNLTEAEARELVEQGSTYTIGDITDFESGSKVSFKIECDGYTIDDLGPDDPNEFIKQGPLMAIMEQLLSGLSSKRGVSFDSAIEDAAEKMNSAVRMAKLDSLKDIVTDKLAELLDKIGDDVGESMQDLKAGSTKEGHC